MKDQLGKWSEMINKEMCYTNTSKKNMKNANSYHFPMNQMEWTKYCNTHLHQTDTSSGIMPSNWTSFMVCGFWSKAKFRICQIQLLKKLATYDKLEELELEKKKEIWNPTNTIFGWSFHCLCRCHCRCLRFLISPDEDLQYTVKT